MSKFKLLTLKSLYLLQFICGAICYYLLMLYSKNADEMVIIFLGIILLVWQIVIFNKSTNLTKKSHDE